MHNGVPVRYGKPTRRRDSKLPIIIIIIIILALLAGSYFVYNKFLKNENPEAEEVVEKVNPPFELIIIEDEEPVTEEDKEPEDEELDEQEGEQIITEVEVDESVDDAPQSTEVPTESTPAEPLVDENPEALVQ